MTDILEADIKVDLIDHMGDDVTVCNAARVSFNKRTEWVTKTSNAYSWVELDVKDEKLIKYLASHGHWTPFGHCTAQFRIKAPIFVARQLVKHQTGLVWNEVSRRYVDSDPEFYFPTRWRKRALDKKQGSADGEFIDIWEKPLQKDSWGMPIYAMPSLHNVTQIALETYRRMLTKGVAPEQARIVLPINVMTEWYWTGSLYAFARVCNLRLPKDAQEETREVAAQISTHMQTLFPACWKYLIKEIK